MNEKIMKYKGYDPQAQNLLIRNMYCSRSIYELKTK